MKIGDKVRIRETHPNCEYWGKEGIVEKKDYGLYYLDSFDEYFGDEHLETMLEYETRQKKHNEEYQPKHAKEIEVHHPSHYQLHKHECIEEMIAVFGIEDTKTFCKLNVWKYRYRHTGKNGEKDLHKADEYMDILMNLEKR